MRCPRLDELPPAPKGKVGWPWTTESQRLDESGQEKIWPRISLVVPSFNKVSYIEECIRSVLLQGYPDLELIVIDAASTDGTVDIIRKYEPWISTWVSEPDRGQAHAINKGLDRSTGRFFNWHNADDLLTPGSLQSVSRVFMNHPDVSYVHGQQCRLLNGQPWPANEAKRNYDGSIRLIPRIEKSLSLLNGGTQPGCLMDRDLVFQAGKADEKLFNLIDRDLMLRLAFLKPPLYVDLPLALIHLYSGTKSFEVPVTSACERLHMVNKLFSSPLMPERLRKYKRSALSSAHRYAWQVYVRAKRMHRAAFHFLLDLYYSPVRHWKYRAKYFREKRYLGIN